LKIGSETLTDFFTPQLLDGGAVGEDGDDVVIRII
jgi:hypothetical protein